MTLTIPVSNNLLIEAIRLRCKFWFGALVAVRKATGSVATDPSDPWMLVERYTASEMFAALEDHGIDPNTIDVEAVENVIVPLPQTEIYQNWVKKYGK